ncbi:MAG: hypothetical protein KAU22_02410 [Desulfuromonadales bacterium]|nr:hypothetical protein [Desulfuromonadales bacterium]
MKKLLIFLQLCTALGLLFLLSGCLISASGGHGRVTIGSSTPTHHPKVHKPGPPPHAKAHGHRAKHSYYYYPNSSVYFDTGRNLYFHLDSGGIWRVSVSLPQSLSIRLGGHVSIEMETEHPYVKYSEHLKKYPAGKKNKKKKKKNKWE